MRFSIVKAEKFLKSYPQCKGVIYNILHNYLKNSLVEGEENNTNGLVEKCKKFYDYDTDKFKSPILQGFKYKLELLNDDCPDHNVLKSSLIGTNIDEEKLFWSKADLIDESKAVKIYRAVPSDETAEEDYGDRESSKKVLLLRRASASKVEEILKAGLKPSRDWCEIMDHGLGVYHSNCVKTEYEYYGSRRHAQDKGVVKKITYFFVNQVTIPDKFSPADELKFVSYKDYNEQEPTLQVVDVDCDFEEPGSFKGCHKDKFDGAGRKILNGSFHRNVRRNKVVAHHDLVKPAYLLEIAEKPVMSEIVEEVSDISYSDDQKNFTERNFESFTEELAMKIADWKLKYLHNGQHWIEKDVHSAVTQLSFNLASLLEPKYDAKYRTELVQQQDDDYQFIMKLIENKGYRGLKKVRNVYKVNPVVESEALNLKDKYLFFHGVTSNEVRDILANGYPRDDVTENTSIESVCAKGDLYPKESYCMDGNVPRKLSFAFVSSSGVDCEEFRLENSEFVRDSRGICIDVSGSNESTVSVWYEGGKEMTSERFVTAICGRAPAYLLIF